MRIQTGHRGLAVPLVCLFLIAMGAAWIIATPPGAAPDEKDHYIKAIGVGGGDLAGDPSETTAQDLEAFSNLIRERSTAREVEGFFKGGETKKGRWLRGTAREFSIPAGLGFPEFGCGFGRPEVSASCLEQGEPSTATVETESFMGTYQPYVYIPPGVVMRSTRDAATAMRLGRLVNAVLSLGLISVAAFLLWERSNGALSLGGLIVALTPAVIFVSTTLTSSGLEIAASICLTASLLRVGRSPDRPSWAWLGVAAGGVVLALARSLGPVFVVLIVIAITTLLGRRRAAAALHVAPRAAGAAAGAIAVAICAGLAWEIAYQPRLSWDVGTIVEGLGPSIARLPELAMQAVGVFGWVDTRLPAEAYLVWWLMLGVLLAVAFAVSPRGQRRLLVGLCVSIILITIGVSAVVRQTGFNLQGRHVLPIAVVLPLWAGELINRYGYRLGPQRPRHLILGLAVAAAGVHAFAWYATSRRHAVGVDGDWLFVPDAEWVPPLGWLPWLALVVVAAACYVLAGLMVARTAK